VQPSLSRIGEAAFLGDGNKIAQMTQFHSLSYISKAWDRQTKSWF
jgi:hypothetical protein